jgi:hypothetical protein
MVVRYWALQPHLDPTNLNPPLQVYGGSHPGTVIPLMHLGRVQAALAVHGDAVSSFTQVSNMSMCAGGTQDMATCSAHTSKPQWGFGVGVIQKFSLAKHSNPWE